VGHQVTRRGMMKACLMAAAAGAVGSVSTTAQAAATAPAAKDYDAIILGAGTAGLVAAVEAYNQGIKPVVLEKMDLPAGNSIYAMGGVAACGTRIQKQEGVTESQDDLFADMMKVSADQADPALTRTYVEHIGEDVDWLQDTIGVKFRRLGKLPFPLLSRLHWVDGGSITGGGMLIRLLLAACKKRNIPILYHAKAVELITNKKIAVTGVHALTEDGLVDFKARGGVLIATGGFSANREMLCGYLGGVMSRLPLRGSSYVTGENITLTKPLFAKLVHMDQFHCGPIVSATHVNPQEALNSGYGIIVDLRGKRIIDEVNTYVAKARALPNLTPENKAYQLVDSNWPAVKKMADKCTDMNSPFFQDDTVEGLAKKAGLPVEAVVAAVNGYNDALKNNKLKDLNPPCTYKDPHEMDKGPFYAFPFESGMTATFGGPKINTNAQVVNLEDAPIKGLYAAGNAAGGLFFGDYIGGTQLGGATVFGRIAARHIAQACKKGKKA
jgi:fumarate reductase flavoprotein subunit